MIAFISRAAIKSSGKQLIATTVESGMLLELAIKDLGGRVIRGKVGDVFAAHLAQDNNAALGVESVGVYILPQAGYYPESIFAALTLLRSIKRASDIRSFLATLPPLFFLKDKIACANENKSNVMAKIRQQSDKLGAASLNDLDGLRFEFAEGWLLIRASGTEPAIRVLAEANSQQHARSLLNMGLSVLKDAARGLA